MIPLLIIE